MAAKAFSFRLSPEGAQQVIADMKTLAGTSAEADRALQTLIRSSPQLASAADRASQAVEKAAASMKSAGDSADRLRKPVEDVSHSFDLLESMGGNLGKAFATGGAMGVGLEAGKIAFEKIVEAVKASIEAIPEAGDTYKQVAARLEAITGSAGTASAAYAALDAAARKTGISVETSSEGFVRLMTVTKDIGATSAQIAKLVTGIQELGIISGTSTAEVDRAVYDLSHGLASGVLQGQSLKALMQQMPSLARDLAGELGTTIGKLREMGSAGELTTDVVFPALLKVSEKVGEQFEKMPPTIGRAQGVLNAAMNDFLVGLDKSLGLSTSIANRLLAGAGAIDTIRRGLFRSESEAADDAVKAASQKLDRLRNPGQDTDIPGGDANEAIRLADQGMSGQAPGDSGQKKALQQAEQELRDALDRQRTVRLQAREDKDAEDADAAAAAKDHQHNALVTQTDALKMELDKRLKITTEFNNRVEQLDKAKAGGVIDDAEYDHLRGLAQKAEDDALKSLDKAKKAKADSFLVLEEALAKLQDTASKAAQSVEASIDPQVAMLDKLKKEVKELNDAVLLYDSTQNREGGPIGLSPERAQQLKTMALDEYTNALDASQKTTDKLENSVDQFFAKSVSGFEAAIVSGKGFSSVLQGIEKDLATLIVRQALLKPLTDALSNAGGVSGVASSAFKYLFGSTTPSTGPGPGFDNTIAGGGGGFYASGGIMGPGGNVPLKKYAGGGIANTPQMSIFGEGSQPEAYVPLPDGRRIPVAMDGGAGGMTVHQGDVHIHVTNTNASPEQIGAMVTMASSRANADLLTQIERGGTTARQVGRRR